MAQKIAAVRKLKHDLSSYVIICTKIHNLVFEINHVFHITYNNGQKLKKAKQNLKLVGCS